MTSYQIQFSYLSKHGRLFSGVTEWIYLPAHPGACTCSKLLLQKGEAQGMLVYHGVVVGTGLVIHTPSSQHKLKTTWKQSFYGHHSQDNEKKMFLTFSTDLKQFGFNIVTKEYSYFTN